MAAPEPIGGSASLRGERGEVALGAVLNERGLERGLERLLPRGVLRCEVAGLEPDLEPDLEPPPMRLPGRAAYSGRLSSKLA